MSRPGVEHGSGLGVEVLRLHALEEGAKLRELALARPAVTLAAPLPRRARRLVDAVDVRPSAVDEWNEALDADLAGTVWNTGGCSSWYLDASGRNSAMWPTFTWKFRKATAAFDIENYRTMRATGGPDAGSADRRTPSEKAAI